MRADVTAKRLQCDFIDCQHATTEPNFYALVTLGSTGTAHPSRGPQLKLLPSNAILGVGHGATAPATEGIGSSITADGRAATQSNIAKASMRQLRRSHDYPETHLNRGRRRDCCQKVDVIVAIGGPVPTRAAKSATSTIPIIFAHGGDPVSDGLVRSFKRAQNVDGSYAATAT